MRINVTLALAAIMSLSLGFGACKKRVAVTGAEVKNSDEGRACPKDVGTISDGENNSNQIADIQGRGGYWYTFVDDAGSTIVPEAGKNGGTFAMTPGGANGTQFAAHMTGSIGGGGTIYGGMGLNFVDPKGQYDASKFKGITFWAKKGPGSTGNVRLKVPDVSTDPDGKLCKECFNDFGLDLQLTEEWTQYTIPFTSMKMMKDWGSPRADGIDPKTLYGMQWQVNEPGAKFDVWIDEIAFTGCGG
jgi:endoglucanase